MRGLHGNSALAQLTRGIERETLRITPSGSLSGRGHPHALGSPLTHPAITTDFSEAQLELITGTHQDVDACVRELTEIHGFIHRELTEELLWPASMPCGIGPEADIPIARYGGSNAAKFKEIYRVGLGSRYGRAMQTISGIHYNFSVPDAIWEVLAKVDGTSSNQTARNDGYLRLIRNFRKHGWLLIYLFGASPAVCKSFLRLREHNLAQLDANTCHLPFATSLRMGPLGYQSEAQSAHRMVYDSLSEFIQSMVPTLTEPYPPYAALGVKRGDSYNQLTDALLQVEAEFYGTIRAKRKTLVGERALVALHRRGIEYVEVRCLDANPFEPIGINVETIRFLDVFLLYSLLSASDGETADQSVLNLENQLQTVHHGRDPNIQLVFGESKRRLVDWAQEILEGCMQIAVMIDSVNLDSSSQARVRQQSAKLRDPSLTPSAILLDLMVERHQPFASLGLELAYQHHATMMQEDVPETRLRQLRKLACQSHLDREAIEAADAQSFDAYLASYLVLHDVA